MIFCILMEWTHTVTHITSETNLVLRRNSAQQEKFNFYFLRVFFKY